MARLVGLALMAAGLGACAVENPGTFPDPSELSYPVTLALDAPSSGGAGAGTLYVISSNFALQYNRGMVHALDLSRLPTLAPPTPGQPVTTVPLAQVAKSQVFIGSFGGKPTLYQRSSGEKLLYIPARSEGALFALKADGATLSCFSSTGAAVTGNDCIDTGIPLVSSDGVRLDQPFATTLFDGRVYITHLAATSVHRVSRTYLSSVDAENPSSVSSIPMLMPAIDGSSSTVYGPPTSDIAASGDTLFVTDALSSGESPLRAIQGNTVTDLGLFNAARIYDARAVAISPDGKRIYLTTRGSLNSSYSPTDGPDGMLVIDYDPPTRVAQLRRFVPLPKGASQLTLLPRAGSGPLLLVSCVDSNLLAVYDDDLGETVAAVTGIEHPSGVAVGDRPGGGKRMYVAAFGDNSVAIVDMPDPTHPEDTVLVGRIARPDQEAPKL